MQEKWSVANGHWEIPHSSIRAVCFNCILSPPESLTGGNKLKVPNSYSSEGISERVHDLNAEALKPSFAIIRNIFNLYHREVFLQSYHEEDFKRLWNGAQEILQWKQTMQFLFFFAIMQNVHSVQLL